MITALSRRVALAAPVDEGAGRDGVARAVVEQLGDLDQAVGRRDTGSGRSSAASNALKIVAVPQTASAMVPMTTAEKVGHLASSRTA